MKAENVDSAAPPNLADLITPKQLAKRLGMTAGALYNRLGGWGPEEGVLRLGKRHTLINWPVFYNRMLKGEIIFRTKDE